jgi:ribosomal protein S18 acetylase RimI-like enzyme
MQYEKWIAWTGRTPSSDVLSKKIVGYSSAVNVVDFDSARTDELVRLWRESFEFGVGVVDPHPISDQRDYFVNTVVPHNAVRMAVLDDQLVGFIAATKESIAHLYVRGGHHPRGIGTQLLAWAQAQSIGKLWLHAFARNATARAFYEKHGFVIVARGFEPTWQLDDIKYEWSAQQASV